MLICSQGLFCNTCACWQFLFPGRSPFLKKSFKWHITAACSSTDQPRLFRFPLFFNTVGSFSKEGHLIHSHRPIVPLSLCLFFLEETNFKTCQVFVFFDPRLCCLHGCWPCIWPQGPCWFRNVLPFLLLNFFSFTLPLLGTPDTPQIWRSWCLTLLVQESPTRHHTPQKTVHQTLHCRPRTPGHLSNPSLLPSPCPL